MSASPPPITAATFRRAIKAAREDADLSMSDLARRLACSKAFIEAIENRTSYPSPTRCDQLGRILSLDAAALRTAVATAQSTAANVSLVERARRRAERYRIGG